MRTLNILLVLVFMSLPLLSGAADNGLQFEFAGTVDGIDPENDAIIIGDMAFQISPGLVVLDIRNQPIDPGKLTTGMKVGINTYQRGEQQDAVRYVHEIQIFHNSVDLEKLMDDN